MQVDPLVALWVLGKWHQKVKFGNPCIRRLRRYAACFLAAVCLCAVFAQRSTGALLFSHPSQVSRHLPAKSPAHSRVKPTVHRSAIALQNRQNGKSPGATNLIVTPNFTDSLTKDAAADAKLLNLGLLDTVSAALGTLPLWKTVGEGESLLLSIGVDLGPLVSLQWYFNDVPIAGANEGSLLISNINSDKVGRYQLRATVLGITLVSIPTDVQINKTDETVDRSSAAFDRMSDARAIEATAKSKGTSLAKSGGTSHGFSGTQIFSTAGATKEPGEPNHCGVTGGASEWFAWQPPTNGTAVVNTDGSSFDTVLAIYIGPGDSFATLTNVACDNDSGANGKTSRVVFQAKAGTIYYMAVDGVNGASGTVKLNYTVGSTPEIVSQPTSRAAKPGTSFTLSATASGFPAPRYQWSFNGTNIAGATNVSITLSNISSANFGTYQFRATNSVGAAFSIPADVVPESPLHITTPRFGTNGFTFSARGPAGTNYVVERSSDLNAWTPIHTNRAQTGLFSFGDPAVSGSSYFFYRLKPVP